MGAAHAHALTHHRGEWTAHKIVTSLSARPTMVRAMTMPGAISAAGVAPAGKRVWRDEMTETVKLALPIALTQLGQIAMMTSDLALIGRLGDKAVAAAALAHTVLFTVFVLGMGLVSAVAPLAAQAYGARQPRMVRARAARRTVGVGHPRRAAHHRAALGRRNAASRSASRARRPSSRSATSTASRGASFPPGSSWRCATSWAR